MGEYPGSIDYFVDPSRVFVGTNSHSAITLHGTGGNPDQTVEELGDWFRINAAMVSSHFGIGRDGRIAQYVRLADGAAANCCLEAGYDPFWDQFHGDNLNWHTISIEHENDASNILPLTPAQQDSSFNLIAWLCNTYGLTYNEVKTHASIAPSSRARCPGPNFPMDELKTFLNGGNTQMNGTLYGPGSGSDFDQWFTVGQDGNWTCKQTGAVLMGGNLGLYRTLSIDGKTLPVIGLPLTSEQYQPDGTSEQPCERAKIRYDPKHKIDSQPGLGSSYLAHVDWNPPTVTVTAVPATVTSDLQQIAQIADKYK